MARTKSQASKRPQKGRKSIKMPRKMLKSQPHVDAVKKRRPSSTRRQRANLNREIRKQSQGVTEFTKAGVENCIRFTLASMGDPSLIERDVVDLVRLALVAVSNSVCNTICTNLQFAGTRTITPAEVDRAIHVQARASGKAPFDSCAAMISMLYRGEISATQLRRFTSPAHLYGAYKQGEFRNRGDARRLIGPDLFDILEHDDEDKE
jgi:hypothetical protein